MGDVGPAGNVFPSEGLGDCHLRNCRDGGVPRSTTALWWPPANCGSRYNRAPIPPLRGRGLRDPPDALPLRSGMLIQNALSIYSRCQGPRQIRC